MVKPKRQRSPLTPLIGLIIAVILGVIAWLTAPDALRALEKIVPSLAGNEQNLVARGLFTAAVVLLTLIVFGLVAALTTPKDPQTARESQLEKERDDLRRRQKAERAEARKRR